VGKLGKEYGELRDRGHAAEAAIENLQAQVEDLKKEAGELRKLREKWEPVIEKFVNGPGKLFLKG